MRTPQKAISTFERPFVDPVVDHMSRLPPDTIALKQLGVVGLLSFLFGIAPLMVVV